jgi:beta-lactam-binding protein with PASTA domain/tRNA A-37 threonylcarbamoyl transferase component Bud32
MTEAGDETIRLGDRYELGGLLGRGGMADVRIGRDLRLGRTVAVKQLRSDLAADDTFQARFRKEAQSTAALNHPSIGAVYDTGETLDSHGNHVPYIVMEYIEGQTLRDILRGAEDGRKILPERALSITADVLSAIDYSHRSGIIHRDIKPANVMLTPSGQVKVMDFGIARAIADTSSAMTQTAAVIGTAQYLSPEQARGETVDARSDIYSTGCLLYELLTGRPPFIGESPVSVAYQHVREEARPPSQLNPDVSSTIDHIVAKALAKRVDDRYQSAADMRKDIDRAISGQHVDAPTAATAVVTGATAVAPIAPPVLPGARRAVPNDDDEPPSNGKWWAIGIIGVILLGALAYGIYKWTSPPPEVAKVAVTDVGGKPVDVATTALENAGFKVNSTIKHESSKTIDKDLVIATDPPSGSMEPKGTSVTLTVSEGPKQVSIPSFDGFSYAQAKQNLEDKGLKVQRVTQDSELKKNQVINTDPPAGELVDVGSTVRVIVSAGQSTVPNVVGMSKDDATKALEDAGLKVQVTEDPTSTDPQDQVTAQDVPQGQKVPPNTTVTITVSTNPTPPATDADGGGDGGP